MRTDDIRISFTPEAIQCLTDVEKLVQEARQWVMSGDWLEDSVVPGDVTNASAIYVKLKVQLATMERSWHVGVIGLIKLAGGFRNLRITRDGEYGLAFFQPESGFSGALLPHWYEHEGQRTKLCDWSSHT